MSKNMDQLKNKPLFYSNYDLGSGWSGMQQFKSIKDFLKRRRKKHLINTGGSIADADVNKCARLNLINRVIKLSKLDCNNLDFALDSQITPILNESNSYTNSVYWGSLYDNILPLNDFEGKSPDQLNFGNDYADPLNSKMHNQVLEDKINPAEPPIYGLQDGIIRQEDLDGIENKNPWYGILDLGPSIYSDTAFI
jgi:hypothetical protein